MWGVSFFEFSLQNASLVSVVSTAKGRVVVGRSDHCQACAHRGPKSSSSQQETLGPGQCSTLCGVEEPGLGASRFRFNPWLALWPRICSLASLSPNFLILKKMMRPGSGVCCKDSRSCLKVCSMVPGELLAAVIICRYRQRLSRVQYRRRSQKSPAWASVPFLAGFCRLVFILHRESRKSVVSSEFPALLSFVSPNCPKGLKETTSAFECPRGQRESTFHDSIKHANDYDIDDGPGMLGTLSHCGLNVKPTRSMPIQFPFFGWGN